MAYIQQQRAWPLRLPSTTWLILLTAVLVFAVTFASLRTLGDRQHDEVLTALDAQAHFAVVSVDTRISIELQQLRDLAASEHLKRSDFDAFYNEAKLFASRTRRQVVLLDVPRNTQIFNTAFEMHARLQEGARFMQKAELDSVRPDRPYISNLFYAQLAQKRLIALAVPVVEDGRVVHLLGVAIDPAEIFSAIKEATLASGTVTTIVDRNGVILARSAENDRFAGRTAPTNAAQRTNKSGRFKGMSFDGVPLDMSYLQSDLSGWAAVSFTQDRRDSHWTFAIALLAALLVVVLGSINAIVTNARQRRADETSPDHAE